MLGQIPRDMVLGMIARYQSEKEEKTGLAAELAGKVTHSQEVEYDIREWVSLMKRYMNVEEIDRELLVQLIDKIIVGQKTVVDGEERLQITIIYNLMGEVE